MSTADTKALIEEAVDNFQAEVPALTKLRLVIELELRGRGDIQLFRVEVPGPRITRDIASDAKVRLSVPRSHFNELAARGQGPPLARGLPVRHRQGHRPGRDPQADPERRGEAGGARPHPQAAREVSCRMPAEWAAHDRTLMAWPAREAHVGASASRPPRPTYAEVANAIAAFEPVTMVARSVSSASRRARRAASGVTVSEIPIDDSWLRDSGPDLRARRHRARAPGVDFGFNAWGEKFEPYDDDAEVAARLLERLGEERIDARDFILEGGSIAVDGEGTLVTTEQCLLHPKRNPALSKDEIARRLQDELGVHTVVWLGQGLVEDLDTDGHVDNICAFDRARARAAPDRGRGGQPELGATRARTPSGCRRRAWRSWSCRCCRTSTTTGRPPWSPTPTSTSATAALIVPVAGQETDEEALALLGGLYPGREVVAVAGHDARPGRRRGPLHHAAGPRRAKRSSSAAAGRRRGRRSASRR